MGRREAGGDQQEKHSGAEGGHEAGRSSLPRAAAGRLRCRRLVRGAVWGAEERRPEGQAAPQSMKGLRTRNSWGFSQRVTLRHSKRNGRVFKKITDS